MSESVVLSPEGCQELLHTLRGQIVAAADRYTIASGFYYLLCDLTVGNAPTGASPELAKLLLRLHDEKLGFDNLTLNNAGAEYVETVRELHELTERAVEICDLLAKPAAGSEEEILAELQEDVAQAQSEHQSEPGTEALEDIQSHVNMPQRVRVRATAAAPRT